MKLLSVPLASILIVAILISGCATTISGEPKKASLTSSKSKAILQKQVCTTGGPGPRTAFFLTISGGGSRAAFFGARVLSELKVVDGSDLSASVNAISSVSGGSIAASLYGISTDQPTDETWRPSWDDTLIQARLAADLKIDMVKHLTNPVFLGGYLFGQKNRTDALFAALDSTVLGISGEKKQLTMADLNPDRPQIIINSTVATMDDSTAFRPRPFGSLFTFSPSDLDSIGVDYATMPLSRAVAASAAFPGMLSPVVLNRFQLGSTEQERGTPKFMHLIDGGNVDNLGLLAVKRALVENSHRLLTECDQVVVLTVDAFGAQGVHMDDTPSMHSALGWIVDGNTVFSAFDALLAANRTRLLAEFKSRVFTPPADSALCRKDDLPPDVCLGGVRVKWDEVNALLKKKLLFVHLSFDSEEITRPPTVVHCRGKWPPVEGEDNGCDYPPINAAEHFDEARALRSRLKRIPTTFGLSREEMSDITLYVKLLFNPQNQCLIHMRDMLTGATQHNYDFYEKASNSCDETSSFTDEQLIRARSHTDIFGDWIRTDGSPIKTRPAEERPRYVSATVEAREAFWKKVLSYYGWNGSEIKHQ